MENAQVDPATAIVAFVDLQEGIVNVGSTADPQRLRAAVAALAQIAALFDLPLVVTAVPTTSGTVAPLLAEIGVTAPALVRTSANPLDDADFRAALDASGRRTVILAGVATEVAIRLAALSARRAGYAVILAVDACSGLDARTEAATFVHLSAAGVDLSSVAAIAAQLAGDFRSETGQSAMRALQSVVGSHRRHDNDPDHRHDHRHQHDHERG